MFPTPTFPYLLIISGNFLQHINIQSLLGMSVASIVASHTDNNHMRKPLHYKLHTPPRLHQRKLGGPATMTSITMMIGSVEESYLNGCNARFHIASQN